MLIETKLRKFYILVLRLNVEKIMAIRIAKIILLISIACYLTLIVLNNITDYEMNHNYVSHILAMDTIYHNSPLKWRAIDSPFLHHAFFICIISAQALIAALCWAGAFKMLQARRYPQLFNQQKSLAIYGLSLGIFLWLVCFLAIAGEWFSMWQSRTYNGQQASFRYLIIFMLAIIFISQKDEKEVD